MNGLRRVIGRAGRWAGPGGDDAARSDPTSLRSVGQFLSRFVRPERRRFGLGLGALAVEASTTVLQVWPLAYLIDYLNGQQGDLFSSLGGWSPRTVTIAALTAAMVLMAALTSATDSWAEILLAKAGRNLGYSVRTGLYDHLQGMSLAFHDQLRTGDTITRVTGDVDEVEDFVIDSLSDIFGSIFTLLGTIVFLFYLSWQVALVAILIIPFLALVSHQFSTRIKSAAKSEKKSQGELASVAQEVLTSMRVIQTYGRRDYEVARFGEASHRAVDAALRAAKLQAVFSLVVKVMEAVTIALVVWLGVWLVDREIITLGLIVLFVLQIENMFKPTRKIIKEWNRIGRLMASAGRIEELFRRRPTIVDEPDALDADRLEGRVHFDHVDFTYRLEDEDAAELPEGFSPERVALRDVSFIIDPGEVVAIVGHTGAGKSTIAQLVPRLYDPTGGSVRIDGHDIRSFTIDSLRANVSMVHQDTLLFSGSVLDNIAYGREGANREAVEEAARRAYAHEFIVDLPDGYDTLLGERGVGLSGGQRQRIAIARCLMRDTPVLILDEPTTGLDAMATEVVLDALEQLIEGRTTIIISHDLQLVARADRVVVLDHGEIVETGTHEELCEAGGPYAELRAAQLGEAELHPASVSGSSRAILLDRYPELRPAFDEDHMRSLIAKTLVDDKRYSLESVAIEKDRYDVDDEIYRFRYRCRLLGRSDRSVHYGLLLAHFFGDPAELTSFRRDVIEPLLDDSSPPLPDMPFTSPLAEFEEFNLVVTGFPLDTEMPALRTAMDSEHMAEVFTRALGRAIDPADVSVGIAHYGRRDRCALRYEVEASTYYGKLRTDGTALHTQLSLRSLNGQLARRRSTGLLLPELVTVDEDKGLLIMTEVPGTPSLKDEILAIAEEPDRAGRVIADVGRVAAFLHSCKLDHVDRRTMDDELEQLATAISQIRRGSPRLGRTLHRQLELLGSIASGQPAQQLRLGHGDFTPSQFLLGEHSIGLVDFDTLCRAEPARDLGQFLAYCRLVLARSDLDAGLRARSIDQIEYALLAGYHVGFGAEANPCARAITIVPMERLRVYEAVSLTRMSVHSWMKNKDQRLTVAMTMLDEVLEALGGVAGSDRMAMAEPTSETNGTPDAGDASQEASDAATFAP